MKVLPLLPLLLVWSSPFISAATITTTPSALYAILPQSVNGTNGVSTQARLISGGTYANMSYNYNSIGNYSWYYQTSSPGYQIYRGADITSTTSGNIATPKSIYAPGPAVNTFDKIIRISLDMAVGFDAVRITGDSLHYRISGASNVSNGIIAFIYKNEVGFGSPVWTGTWNTNDNTFRGIDVTIPVSTGDKLFFAVNNRGSGIATHFSWVNVNLTATNIPEPSSVFLISLAALGLMRRRR